MDKMLTTSFQLATPVHTHLGICYAKVVQSTSRRRRGEEKTWFLSNHKNIRVRGGDNNNPDSLVVDNTGQTMWFETADAASEYYSEKLALLAEHRFEYRGEGIFDASIVASNDKYLVRYVSARTARWVTAKDEDDNDIEFGTEQEALHFIDGEILKIAQQPVSMDEIKAKTSAPYSDDECTGEELIREIGLWFDSPEWDCMNTGRIYRGDRDRLDKIIRMLVSLKYQTNHHGTTPIEAMVRNVYDHERFMEWHPVDKLDRDALHNGEVDDYIRYITEMSEVIRSASDCIKLAEDLKRHADFDRRKKTEENEKSALQTEK
jgi:hypothetical protein